MLNVCFICLKYNIIIPRYQKINSVKTLNKNRRNSIIIKKYITIIEPVYIWVL